MGFNFRKSIKVGKNVRINLSKSGIGWSVGTKGARYTKSANGSTRTTLSLPGTGLSYTIPGKSAADKAREEREEKLEKALENFDGTVYFAASGKCYHLLEECGGRSLPRSATIEQAQEWGMHPCSRCCKK